jgi:hypothetical protein
MVAGILSADQAASKGQARAQDPPICDKRKPPVDRDQVVDMTRVQRRIWYAFGQFLANASACIYTGDS